MEAVKQAVTIPAQERDSYKEGDYIKDDLLHCGKCNTPKEIFSTWESAEPKPAFIPDTFPVMCKCRREQYDKEQEAEKRREHLMRVDMLKQRYVTDKQYLNMTFDVADNDSDLDWAQNYVKAWDDEIKNDENAGLLLYGDTGTGKTFAACCIGNALLEQEESVMIANIADLLDRISGYGDSKKEELLEKIQSCELLIIDDFGATRETGFANEQIYKIIDSRYRAKKPMIITTNLTPNQIAQEQDIDLKRTYQRVIERCRAVAVNGNNRRLDIAKQSKAKMDNILFGNKNTCQGE